MLDQSRALKSLTITMPPDTHRRFKSIAVHLGIPMKDLLVEVIEKMIAVDVESENNKTIFQ